MMSTSYPLHRPISWWVFDFGQKTMEYFINKIVCNSFRLAFHIHNVPFSLSLQLRTPTPTYILLVLDIVSYEVESWKLPKTSSCTFFIDTKAMWYNVTRRITLVNLGPGEFFVASERKTLYISNAASSFFSSWPWSFNLFNGFLLIGKAYRDSLPLLFTFYSCLQSVDTFSLHEA